MKIVRIAIFTFAFLNTTPGLALSPEPPPSVCESDYRKIAELRFADTLNQIEGTVPVVSDARIAELAREEAPLRQPDYLEKLGVVAATSLREALRRQPDFLAWKMHEQIEFLRTHLSEIDQVKPDESVDKRYYAVQEWIDFLVEFQRDFATMTALDAVRETPMIEPVSRLSAENSFGKTIDALIDILRCDAHRSHSQSG